jgi:hypothetical protein
MEDQLAESLLNTCSQDREAWDNLQARAAYDKGVAAGFKEVMFMEYEEIKPEEDNDKS